MLQLEGTTCWGGKEGEREGPAPRCPSGDAGCRVKPTGGSGTPPAAPWLLPAPQVSRNCYGFTGCFGFLLLFFNSLLLLTPPPPHPRSPLYSQLPAGFISECFQRLLGRRRSPRGQKCGSVHSGKKPGALLGERLEEQGSVLGHLQGWQRSPLARRSLSKVVLCPCTRAPSPGHNKGRIWLDCLIS